MAIFLDILRKDDPAAELLSAIQGVRQGDKKSSTFDVRESELKEIPGFSFMYWLSSEVRKAYSSFSPLVSGDRELSRGASTMDDFRYLRLHWEVSPAKISQSRNETSQARWVPFAKGGSFSQVFSEVYLLVNWGNDGEELKCAISEYRGSRGWGYQWSAALNGHSYYFRPGLTWPRRTSSLSVRVLPAGCLFADKGATVFVRGDTPRPLLALCALMNSHAFLYFVSYRTQLAQSFEVGLLKNTPIPDMSDDSEEALSQLAVDLWKAKALEQSGNETSVFFYSPWGVSLGSSGAEKPINDFNVQEIIGKIDRLAFDLWGFNENDRELAHQIGAGGVAASEELVEGDQEDFDGAANESSDPTCQCASWAIGVAFGRFDPSQAKETRSRVLDASPFDPQPRRCPGMLPDDAAPFHSNPGVLVDEQGHPHDLPRLIEEVLTRVDAEVPGDVRRWLQRDFFKLHLKQYSKSRRKAPIYWPLSTVSGDYTLWLYYPDLTDQTLFTAVNDFVEPKLQHLESELSTLRQKGQERTSAEEREFEKLQTLQEELVDLRDTLLQLAPTYEPNHDDGVQITAAPLWRLFRYKPWQKVLKDTWEKLEAGDYDWAHLAMSYWPERVREKCKTDKSLAIAHDLEHLYEEPEEPAGGARKRRGGRSGA